MSYFWGWADHEVGEHIFNWILYFFWVLDELVGGTSDASWLSSYFAGKLDSILVDCFESDLIIGDDGDIFAKRLSLDELFGNDLVFNYNIKESATCSDFQSLLMYFLLDSEQHKHLAFDFVAIESWERILVEEVKLIGVSQHPFSMVLKLF